MTTENDETKRGRGRPKKEESRRKVYGVRFSEDEETMLKHLEIETGMTTTDLVRKAVKLYYNYTVKRF